MMIMIFQDSVIVNSERHPDEQIYELNIDDEFGDLDNDCNNKANKEQKEENRRSLV